MHIKLRALGEAWTTRIDRSQTSAATCHVCQRRNTWHASVMLGTNQCLSDVLARPDLPSGGFFCALILSPKHSHLLKNPRALDQRASQARPSTAGHFALCRVRNDEHPTTMLNIKHIAPNGDERIETVEAAQFVAARFSRAGEYEPAKIKLRDAKGVVTYLTDPGRFYVMNALGATIASYVIFAEGEPPPQRDTLSARRRRA